MPITLLTDIAEAKITAAAGSATAVAITHIALGDGNGGNYAPSYAQTALRREKARRAILTRHLVDTNASAASLKCSNDTDGTVTNSILLGSSGAASVECAGIEVGYSAVDSEKLVPNGSTNTFVDGGYNLGWFVNPQSGNYHLKPGVDTPFEGAGLWVNGQPTTDYDGDPRPTVDGTVDYVGADIP